MARGLLWCASMKLGSGALVFVGGMIGAALTAALIQGIGQGTTVVHIGAGEREATTAVRSSVPRIDARALAARPATPVVVEEEAAGPEGEVDSGDEAVPRGTFEEATVRVAQSFAAESRDDGWARNAERAVRDAFDRGTFEASRLVEVECRAHACRSVVEHDDDDARDAFSTAAQVRAPFHTSGLITHLDDSSLPRTEIYSAREGDDLPGW